MENTVTETCRGTWWKVKLSRLLARHSGTKWRCNWSISCQLHTWRRHKNLNLIICPVIPRRNETFLQPYVSHVSAVKKSSYCAPNHAIFHTENNNRTQPSIATHTQKHYSIIYAPYLKIAFQVNFPPLQTFKTHRPLPPWLTWASYESIGYVRLRISGPKHLQIFSSQAHTLAMFAPLVGGWYMSLHSRSIFQSFT